MCSVRSGEPRVHWPIWFPTATAPAVPVQLACPDTPSGGANIDTANTQEEDCMNHNDLCEVTAAGLGDVRRGGKLVWWHRAPDQLNLSRSAPGLQ